MERSAVPSGGRRRRRSRRYFLPLAPDSPETRAADVLPHHGRRRGGRTPILVRPIRRRRPEAHFEIRGSLRRPTWRDCSILLHTDLRRPGGRIGGRDRRRLRRPRRFARPPRQSLCRSPIALHRFPRPRRPRPGRRPIVAGQAGRRPTRLGSRLARSCAAFTAAIAAAHRLLARGRSYARPPLRRGGGGTGPFARSALLWPRQPTAPGGVVAGVSACFD